MRWRAAALAAALGACGGGGGDHVIATVLPSGPRLFAAPTPTSGRLDAADGLAPAAPASLFAVEGSGVVLASFADTADVVRYAIDDGLRVAGTMSLSGYGLGPAEASRPIALPPTGEAWLLDAGTLQAVVFDPVEMAPRRTVSLRALAEPGYEVRLAYDAPLREGRIVVVASYHDAGATQVPPRTSLALIDPGTDAVTVVHEPRCGAFTTVARAGDGALYFATDPLAAAINLVGGGSAPPGCLLRLRPGADAFDPDFLVTLRDVTGGQPGGGVVAGAGGTLWFRAFDPARYVVTDATRATDVLDAAAWRWWQLDPAQPGAARAAALPPARADVRAFSAAAHTWAVDAAASDEATLVDLSSIDPTPGAIVPGHPTGVVRAR